MIHFDSVVSNTLVFHEKKHNLFLNTDQTTMDHITRADYVVSCKLPVKHKTQIYVFTNQTQYTNILALLEAVLRTWYYRAPRRCFKLLYVWELSKVLRDLHFSN